MKNGWKRVSLRSLVSKLVATIALFFLIRYLIINWIELTVTLEQSNFIYVGVTTFLTLVMLVLMSLGWTIAIQFTGGELNVKDGFSIYYRSSIFRYLPGTVWYMPSRGYLCQKLNIKITEFTTSIIIELFYLLSTAGIFGGWALARKMGWEWLAISITCLIMMLCLMVYPNLLSFSLVQKFVKVIPSRRTHIQLVITYVLIWLFFGASMVVLFPAFNVPVKLTDVLDVISANAAAWLIGFLSFIPLGLGVRESAYVWLVGSLAPTNKIVLMSILQRFIEVFVEMILWIIVVSSKKYVIELK